MSPKSFHFNISSSWDRCEIFIIHQKKKKRLSLPIFFKFINNSFWNAYVICAVICAFWTCYTLSCLLLYGACRRSSDTLKLCFCFGPFAEASKEFTEAWVWCYHHHFCRCGDYMQGILTKKRKERSTAADLVCLCWYMFTQRVF